MIVRALAELEIQEIAMWYEDQQEGVGFKFLDAIDQSFERIQQFPELYAIVDGDVRRALLRRFPFAVYYRIERDKVTVLTVIHSKRDLKTWQIRLN